MRPEILYPLFAPVTSLAGVGPRIGKLIAQAAGPKLVDLLWHMPSGLIDRRYAPRLSEAQPGRVATILVTVVEHRPPRSPRLPYRIMTSDGSGSLELVFFHGQPDYLRRLLPEGARRVVSGRLESFHDALQMTHPDHVVEPEQAERLRRVEPVYPLTAGLTPRIMAKAVHGAIARAPALAEWQDPELLRRRGWPDWLQAVRQIHAPQEPADLELGAPARARLAYDELLASQLALGLLRTRQRQLKGRVLRGDGSLRARAMAALSFTLTASQDQALREIAADMASPHRMLRLLHGDVGSGKTVVATLAMLNAVEAGGQAVLMAPTELLTRQHHATIAPLAAAAGVEAALLTGREKGKVRDRILERLAEGATPIVIGTHALFQEEVAFRDLALAVIDEQHRFGVHQRLTLTAKGRAVDVLVMTATPIPRTLMMAAYGDLEASRLTEKPAGRQPITTRVLPNERLGEVIAAAHRALAAGGRIYWVCPLVQESEAVDLAAASERKNALERELGPVVGLIHGQMKGAERDAAMARFIAGDTRLLVATTVIEVGVDVPEASVMVIEHAERFGLAQLHQLRGRIGRGAQASTCLLLYQAPLSATAKARLEIMRETDDGFRIAEEDLRLRGAGEVLGTRQSGLPVFRIADLAAHADLLAIARDDARLVLEKDPGLAEPRGQALKTLLYLFERETAAPRLRAG